MHARDRYVTTHFGKLLIEAQRLYGKSSLVFIVNGNGSVACIYAYIISVSDDTYIHNTYIIISKGSLAVS